MMKRKIPLLLQHRWATKRGQTAATVRGPSLARLLVNWTAVLAASGLLAAPAAEGAIVFEEVVTGTGSSTSTLLPSIQGGSSQTYIVFIETENNSDVTAVSGGGLTWAEQKEQCGAADVVGSRVWTAQGSPGGAFQAQITKSGTKKLTAVLVRYSGAGGFEGAAGENKNGINDTSCGGGETSTAQLTLTSTQVDTVHLAGVGMKAKTVDSVTPGYTLLGSEIQNTSKAYLYARSFASATTDQLQASLSGGDSWATAGLVLVPAGNTAPSISKAFVPASILSGGASTLTFTLSNPNAGGLTGASFTDAYPAGMTNTAPLVTGGSCANVMTTAVAGGASFDVTAGDIPAAASCTITVDVTSTATGANTSSVLSTSEAPDSATGASDTLSVPCPGGTVTTTADSATGESLRACIIWANLNPGTDTLTLPAGAYTLTIAGTGEDAAATGDLDITDDIVINGNAASSTVIDGNTIDRVFEILGAGATFSNLTIRNGNVGGNGGGIALDATASATLSASTLSGNTTAADGGGIATAGGTVLLTNVTLSGNTANRGGGLDCHGPCTLTNATLTANTAPVNGGGVRQRTGAGTITFLNSIVANNSSGGAVDCDGSAANLFSNGNNLSSDNSCDFTSPGDLVNTNPQIGPLQNNGGPTSTHALLAGSPAIDGGANTGCPATDQRGVARPFNVSCDIGAYESDVALPSLSIVKSTLTLEDPVSGTTDPKAIPGAIERYLIEIANTGSGPADADTVFVTDSLPAIMALRVIDFDAVNPGPVAYVDGSPSSGLSYTFTSLGSGTDDIEFSSDGGSTWTYTPVDSGDGTDPAVTDIRINPKGIFVNNTGGGDPGFQLRFKAVIQ